MINPDGSAQCDRCGVHLDGYGVLYGLVTTDLNGIQVRELIFCYINNCRGIVLQGLVNYSGTDCADCNLPLPVRSIDVAMLTSDLDPAHPGQSRNLAFCYRNGSRDKLLAKATMGT